MSLPSSITSASAYDAGSDDPKQARAQLKGLHDDVEAINDHLKASPLLSPATPLGIGDGLEASAGNLRVQLDSNPGLARAAAGLSLDVNGLTAETAPAAADLVALYDVTAAAHRKMTLQNLLKVINALTEDTAPDKTADFLLAYDTSAGLPKKVKPSNLSSGAWVDLGTVEASSNATVDITFNSDAYEEVYILGESISQGGSGVGVTQFRLREDGGSWLTTGYDFLTNRGQLSPPSSMAEATGTNQGQVGLTGSNAFLGGPKGALRVQIANHRSTARPIVKWDCQLAIGATALSLSNGWASLQAHKNLDGFRLLNSAGTVTFSGTFNVWGLQT